MAAIGEVFQRVEHHQGVKPNLDAFLASKTDARLKALALAVCHHACAPLQRRVAGALR